FRYLRRAPGLSIVSGRFCRTVVASTSDSPFGRVGLKPSQVISLFLHAALAGARPRPGAAGAALRAVPAGHAGDDGRPDPRVRVLARGPGGTGPDAGLDPDADRTQPARPEDIPAVGSDPLSLRDATGKQGTRAHHRGRCAP